MSATADGSVIRSMLISVRPRVMAALTRYFGDMDVAEEGFQTSCLRALQAWPDQGIPRDPVGWLILVGRNAGIDDARRRGRTEPLPDDDRLSDREDHETIAVNRLDASHYRDDILRLLFVCCLPALRPAQQIALALRVVCGMTPRQIAQAFLVNERTMQQRITRAKAAVAAAGVLFDPPSRADRVERLTHVLAIIYLIFNEGYSTGLVTAAGPSPLCVEAVRLARLLLRLFPTDPETMGLTALMLLHQARSAARFDPEGGLILMDAQDRTRWDRQQIAEALALIDKAMRHRTPGAYQIQAAVVALHVRATTPEDTDWVQIEYLYRALERLQPSPVVALNRAIALAEISGPQAALDLIDPLAEPLSGYFNYYAVRGGLLLRAGRFTEARVAFNQAIPLARTTADAVYIHGQLDQVSGSPAGEPRSAVSRAARVVR